jgi:hypothetical protein
MLTAEKAGFVNSPAFLTAVPFAASLREDVRDVFFTDNINGSPPTRVPDTTVILRI